MLLMIIVLSLIAFFKTIGYAIYEYQNNSNKIASIIIVILAFIGLIGPCIVTFV